MSRRSRRSTGSAPTWWPISAPRRRRSRRPSGWAGWWHRPAWCAASLRPASAWASGSPSPDSAPCSRCWPAATWNGTSGGCATSTPAAALGAASRPAGRDDKAGPAGGQGRQRRSGPGTGVVLLGDTAGMHLVLELPPGTACRAAAAARQAGVAAATLDRYYAGTPAREGLVLGYGQATTGQIEQACGILLGVLAGLQPG